MPKRRPWGEGQVERLPSGSFRVRWRENGQRRSETFPTLALAETFRRGMVGDLARERAGLPPDPRSFPTLDRLAAEWIERRKTTHRSWSDDRGRWNLHLSPVFGRMRAQEVDLPALRSFIEKRRRAGMNADTLRLLVACLSTLFSDLCERPRETGATLNPCKGLPKNLRRLLKSDHDPRFTPYVERLLDVRRIFQAMPEPQRVAYAIGVVAGLRPGEILALEWKNIHAEDRRVDVRQQAQDGRPGPLKDREARILQGAFLEPLWPILAAWKLRTGGRGLVFPPELTKRGTRMGAFMHPRRLKEGLETAAKACEMPEVMTWAKPWYQATRHTFATHWLRAGHSLGELALVLGHSATFVTERYAHIRPGEEREDPWTMDLTAKPSVSHLGPRLAHVPRQRTRKRT